MIFQISNSVPFPNTKFGTICNFCTILERVSKTWICRVNSDRSTVRYPHNNYGHIQNFWYNCSSTTKIVPLSVYIIPNTTKFNAFQDFGSTKYLKPLLYIFPTQHLRPSFQFPALSLPQIAKLMQFCTFQYVFLNAAPYINPIPQNLILIPNIRFPTLLISQIPIVIFVLFKNVFQKLKYSDPIHQQQT